MFLKDRPSLFLMKPPAPSTTKVNKPSAIRSNDCAASAPCCIIAHRLSTIRHAQRIIVLTEDGIEEQGTRMNNCLTAMVSTPISTKCKRTK